MCKKKLNPSYVTKYFIHKKKMSYLFISEFTYYSILRKRVYIMKNYIRIEKNSDIQRSLVSPVDNLKQISRTVLILRLTVFRLKLWLCGDTNIHNEKQINE